ncbi:hypothetical protein P175DRAFT_0526162 [Aspergillus ochraceoroseus IBT 24754]|uniref:tRNA (adenine(58)-N(1))-methyltransferase catalytic subunit TRM61 n=1 Tax=Aspergillus ochraceoroseus IBT 24754 TaxID=1392256 RepID=A0A2T5LQ70_9EURO|nr:uncharacterized protein P175DRAFT_0526162 [Aspergillus ochraceoroseus IBT 24754]PTU18416.1 hypothetical protein P175DRAFT_0526162 [Aspergillus ochraceoroseus IBT 24754]
MARLVKSLRQFLGLDSSILPVSRFARSIDTDFSYFREGDRVIVHGKTPQLTKPLRKGQKSDVRRGQLEHDQIIGRRVRDLVQARKGPEYRLTLPTLEEYVALTPRLVTPIYAADANLIVSLLDIHVAPPADGDDGRPPLEILESGTGHGSLTLQLARAIQAANSLPPLLPEESQIQYLQGRPGRPGDDQPQTNGQGAEGDKPVDQTQEQWDTWRAQRKAIIHTVDVSPKFSAHAETIVREFRRGIYAGNVDFYVGHVENWIMEQVRRRQQQTRSSNLLPSFRKSDTSPEPFLTHAILDMPSSHLRIPHVARILKRDGILAVFMPSVTQIGECVDLIRQQKLPFILEKAVELGPGISNGRLWDIRFAVKKSRADPSSWTESSSEPAGEEPVEEETAEAQAVEETPAKDPETALVCRPKVGSRIVGGGFVGIFRRIEDFQAQ